MTQKAGLIALAAFGAGVVFVLLASESEEAGAPSQTNNRSAFSEDDLEGLARMLESETDNQAVWPAIGYLTISAAKRRKISVYSLLTRGAGYGPRVTAGGLRRYADTRQAASTKSRLIARGLLEGSILPNPEIVARNASSWVERLPKSTDQAVLRAQSDFGGIWARIQGSNWYLYNSTEPKISALTQARVIKP